MDEKYMCHTCHTTFEITENVWKCTECGGMLDLAGEKAAIDPSKLKTRPATLWRYIDVLPFEKDSPTWQHVTMGEGYSPLLILDKSEANTFVKVDYMMPTLSFKDRGAAVLIAKAKELGVQKIVADSSGNAGTSFAAYAKRAGIACDVYLKESTSPKKIAQIKSHGATIHTINGNREDIAAAAQEAVTKERVFYASHVYNPYFYEGTKTYAYELWEQMKSAPDTLIIPVGNGTLLLGAYYGFKELLDHDLIDRMPTLIAIQAENCAPLAQAFANNEKIVGEIDSTETFAEGIAIAKPARSKQIIEAVRETKGQFITTTEKEITEARSLMANKGFYVEPTTAANYAGYLKYNKTPDEKIVIPLCGAGIKAN